MKATEHTFRTWDGTELFYRAWLPKRATDKAMILFHRGHEHSGRWQETVEALGLEDIAVFAWDARGHGRSPGERGAAENLAAIIKDADTFARHIGTEHRVPIENVMVLAQSVGAVIAAAWVHDYAPPIRGMILGVPAFRVKLYVPFAVPALRLKQKLLGPGFVKSYVKSKLLTHDPQQAAAYDADPLIFRQIAVNILLDLHDTSTRLLADAGAITAPTLVLAAGSDWVVELGAQQEFFDRLSSPIKRMKFLPGFHHAIYHEKERKIAFNLTHDFIRECFDSPPPRISLLRADVRGYTRDEFDHLNGPGSPHFAVIRAGMKTLGRLSEGIRLGWDAGFDSGRTLDYVYENCPRGTTALGRAFDRAYLNSIGWRGIRQRKVNLQKLLRVALDETVADGHPVRVLDIASGPGRYVLETLRTFDAAPARALLRDYKAENVAAARRLANELELANVACEQSDAFDRAALAAIRPCPTIAIVSGLYELFPANAPVLDSLRGIADALEPGGYLVYTNQPWHPQVEFIARVLRNREGQPWIMRRRTQAEMDELVRAAGFDKLSQEVDEWGIFTVSLARKATKHRALNRAREVPCCAALAVS